MYIYTKKVLFSELWILIVLSITLFSQYFPEECKKWKQEPRYIPKNSCTIVTAAYTDKIFEHYL